MKAESRPDSSSACASRRCSPYTIAIVVLLAALIACGDPYLRTNPYDPAYPVQATITGPDTLFSFGEIGQYSLQTNPAWPDTGVIWAIDTFTDYFVVVGPPPASPCATQVVLGDTVLQGSGNGSYQSIRPPLEPYSFKIAIEVWLGTIDTTIAVFPRGCPGPSGTLHIPLPRHVAYKTVVVTQRLTRIQLRCPDTHACAPLSVGAIASIWVDGFDALGRQIAAIPNAAANPATGNPPLPYATKDTAILRVQKGNNPVATYVSRDSTIARMTPVGVRVARVTAVSPGSTWIVATRGALADSLQVVVH
ncbi:MAG: hypothetical protein ACREN6_17550 [Gemmatimonadaceae bacterium]